MRSDNSRIYLDKHLSTIYHFAPLTTPPEISFASVLTGGNALFLSSVR